VTTVSLHVSKTPESRIFPTTALVLANVYVQWDPAIEAAEIDRRDTDLPPQDFAPW
jgi:hypothetical protein